LDWAKKKTPPGGKKPIRGAEFPKNGVWAVRQVGGEVFLGANSRRPTAHIWLVFPAAKKGGGRAGQGGHARGERFGDSGPCGEEVGFFFFVGLRF